MRHGRRFVAHEQLAILAALCTAPELLGEVDPADVEPGAPSYAFALLADAEPDCDARTRAIARSLLTYARQAPQAIRDAGRALIAERVADRAAVARRTPLEPLGALALWRRELATGQRTIGTEDALAKAARWEASALEADRSGDRAGAERMLREAAALLDHEPARRAA